MLDTLTVTYEGTPEVSTTHENNIKRKYKHLFAYMNESLTNTFNHFNCLINDMRRFKVINHDTVLVLQFLDSLDNKWEHYVEALKSNEKIKSMDL